MKRFVSVLIVSLLLALCLLPAFALADSIDLSTLSNEELLALWEAAGERLVEVGAYPYIEITVQTFGEPVLRLQKRLAKLYYYMQEPSGQYDKATSKAFSAFMKQNGKKAGKTVTVEDQKYLYSTAAIPAPTPTPLPTPTPAPTPFFLQQPLDLNTPFIHFKEQITDYSLFEKLIPVESQQNEFYKYESWGYSYKKQTLYDASPYVSTWTDNSTGKIIAIAFSVKQFVFEGEVADFEDLLNKFTEELGLTTKIQIGIDRVRSNFLEFSPQADIYGGHLQEAKFPQSSDLQIYDKLKIIFVGTTTGTSYYSSGSIVIIGVDDRITALPFLEYTVQPAPTPTPENPSTVSAHEFSQVYVGMPYDDVVYIFGGHGRAGSTSKTTSGTFADYTWKSESGGTISITFLDGEVYMASNYK